MIDDRPALGAFGSFGGRFASELLHPALDQLARACDAVVASAQFQREFADELETWAGRPTPLTEAPRFSEAAGVRVLLKREDLLHGGAHKTNNVVGQALLARLMGKTRLIAETGAGQHGVATAMAGARYGLRTVIYMGVRDMDRQASNVQRMRLCGAEVVGVDTGSGTLKDAINEAMRDWARTSRETHYLLGTVCGPDPFPRLVRSLQEVIGTEARDQCMRLLEGVPAAVIACVGGGSNAIGLFSGFSHAETLRIGVEPGGSGMASGHHGATVSAGTPGLLHGARTLVLQDEDGQITPSRSIAAGLDYPGVGPEHAQLHASGSALYVTATDAEAIEACRLLAKTEGILPALESAHALAFALRIVAEGHVQQGANVVVNLSGRGDKDLVTLDRRSESPV